MKQLFPPQRGLAKIEQPEKVHKIKWVPGGTSLPSQSDSTWWCKAWPRLPCQSKDPTRNLEDIQKTNTTEFRKVIKYLCATYPYYFVKWTLKGKLDKYQAQQGRSGGEDRGQVARRSGTYWHSTRWLRTFAFQRPGQLHCTHPERAGSNR